MGKFINKILRLVISGAVMRSGEVQAEVSRIWAATDRTSFYERSGEARFIEREGLACIAEKASRVALSASAAGLPSPEQRRESQGAPCLGLLPDLIE